MQKEVKFKGASGFMVECARLFFASNSGNFHSNEKNKISESKFASRLSRNFRNQTKLSAIVYQMQNLLRETWCIFVILTWLSGDHGLDYFIFLPLDS